MITISGGIFNFFDSGYSPPTCGGEVYYNFTHSTTVSQIYSTTDYIFSTTSDGLFIYKPVEDKLYAFIYYTGGFTTVGGNENKVYLGTTNSGIKYLNKTCISGSITSAYDLTTCLIDLNTPNITNNNISYLHAYGNNLTVCTNSGVDYFRFDTNPEIHSKTFISGAEKCFTASDSIYYTVSGTNTTTSGMEYSLHRLDVCLCDWSLPSKTYTTGSGIFNDGIKITDMYITENTAEYGGNTIFCSTSSGVYILDEDVEKHAIYYTE